MGTTPLPPQAQRGNPNYAVLSLAQQNGCLRRCMQTVVSEQKHTPEIALENTNL